MTKFNSLEKWESFDFAMAFFRLFLVLALALPSSEMWGGASNGTVNDADISSLLGPMCWVLNLATGAVARVTISMFIAGSCVLVIMGRMSMATGLTLAGGSGGLLAAPTIANAIGNAASTGNATYICVSNP